MLKPEHPPLFILLNQGSGRHHNQSPQQIIEQQLTVAGRKHQVYSVSNPQQLDSIARQVVRQAQQEQGWVIAAGGDGTLNAVAAATLGTGCPFGVLAQGTFNYFSRTHGLSSDLSEAIQQLLTAQIEPVQVGQINDRIFLVNASLGLYPRLLQEREAYKSRYGRSRLIAFLAGLRSLLRFHRPMSLQIESDGQQQQVQASTLWVGNNPLQFEQLGFPEAASVAQGKLAAIRLEPVAKHTMLQLIFQGALGRLAEAEAIDSFAFESLSVRYSGWHSKRRRKVAIDGELCYLKPPFRFQVATAPLLLLKPSRTSSTEAG